MSGDAPSGDQKAPHARHSRSWEGAVRPNEIEILGQSGEDATEALIRRISRLDSAVRLELTLSDGGGGSAVLSSARAQELELAEGQIIAVRVRAACA
jgi:ABC-type sulfate/molybdate transport systems ATPase subunit